MFSLEPEKRVNKKCWDEIHHSPKFPRIHLENDSKPQYDVNDLRTESNQ